jgi:hypothetical protein
MNKPTKKIDVMECKGIYRVAADFKGSFYLVPSPEGYLKLAFWDESRMKVFLRNFGFYPVINHSNN